MRGNQHFMLAILRYVGGVPSSYVARSFEKAFGRPRMPVNWQGSKALMQRSCCSILFMCFTLAFGTLLFWIGFRYVGGFSLIYGGGIIRFWLLFQHVKGFATSISFWLLLRYVGGLAISLPFWLVFWYIGSCQHHILQSRLHVGITKLTLTALFVRWLKGA